MMRKIVWFLAITCSILLASQAIAATYYVSVTGNDKNAGTSQSAPWRNCPGMVGWSGSAQLRPGDKVCFKSTDIWTGGGGQAQYISIKGGVTYDGGAWGGGTRATLRPSANLAKSDAPLVYWVEDNTTYETVFKNFRLDCNKKNAGGIIISRPSKRNLLGAMKRIQNCIIHNSSTVANGGQGIMVGAHNNYVVANIDISDCEIYSMSSNGIMLYEQYGGTTKSQIRNVTVRNCKIYNVGLGTESDGCCVKVKNDVYNLVLEYNSFCSSMRMHGIYIEGDPGTPSPKNIVVRNNIIGKNKARGIAVTRSTTQTSVDIYGNIVYGNGSTGIYFGSDLKGTVGARVYNNTSYQNGGGELIMPSSSAKFSPLEIKDNVFYARSGSYALQNSTANRITSHSNNCYYRSGGGTVVTNGGTSYSTSSIKNWESSGIATDPLFENTGSLPTAFAGTYGKDLKPNTSGLCIKTTSPAKDKGCSLTSTYNTSINSLKRPQGSAWDMGAYEVGSASAPTDPSEPGDPSEPSNPSIPRNLRVVN